MRLLEDLSTVAEVVDDVDAERQVELGGGQCGVFGPVPRSSKGGPGRQFTLVSTSPPKDPGPVGTARPLDVTTP
jgi:hypothetical protein